MHEPWYRCRLLEYNNVGLLIGMPKDYPALCVPRRLELRWHGVDSAPVYCDSKSQKILVSKYAI